MENLFVGGMTIACIAIIACILAMFSDAKANLKNFAKFMGIGLLLIPVAWALGKVMRVLFE